MHSGASVAVTIYLSGNVDDVVTFLEDNGGDPRNVGEDYIEAYVPVITLGQVSEQPGVVRVREIVPAPEYGQRHQPRPQRAPSQQPGTRPGTPAGRQGGGNRQLVLTGFSRPHGHRVAGNVVGQMLHRHWSIHPKPVADCDRRFTAVHHGTAVAETVMDIAPGGVPVHSQPRSGSLGDCKALSIG